MLPLITVIVPVYKVELYIRKCIDSVINQTYQNLEIILVDDGSPDRCPEICDEYAQKDSRIKVIHKQNGGLSDARNAGLDIAQGEYLVFLDSDDLLLSSALFDIYEEILSYEYPDVILNRFQTYVNDPSLSEQCNFMFDCNKLKHLNSDEVYQHCLNLSGFICTACFLVCKRTYIEQKGFRFVKGLFHEDEHWSPLVILNANSIGFNNKSFYCYRIERPGSIMNTMTIQKAFDKLFIVDDFLIEAGKPNYSILAKSLLKRRCRDLFTSIRYDYAIYQKDDTIKSKALERAMLKRKHVLLMSGSIKDFFIWCGFTVLGVSVVSSIIAKRHVIKNKLSHWLMME